MGRGGAPQTRLARGSQARRGRSRNRALLGHPGASRRLLPHPLLSWRCVPCAGLVTQRGVALLLVGGGHEYEYLLEADEGAQPVGPLEGGLVVHAHEELGARRLVDSLIPAGERRSGASSATQATTRRATQGRS